LRLAKGFKHTCSGLSSQVLCQLRLSHHLLAPRNCRDVLERDGVERGQGQSLAALFRLFALPDLHPVAGVAFPRLSFFLPSFFAVTVTHSRDVRNGSLTRPPFSRSCHKRDTGSRESQARSRAKEQLPIPLSSSSLRRPAMISLCRAAETEVVIFCYILQSAGVRPFSRFA
jgi:hypothetical protein